MTPKPLGHRSYGSIGHLPQSRLGPADHSVPQGQGRICTAKARDRHDHIIVQEKLDGSNVGVARLDGQLVPLVRAGYVAWSSRFEQHQHFAVWVQRNEVLFDFLEDGQRCCGEWLGQAHATIYHLRHEPFVAFDVMTDHTRMLHDAMMGLIDGRLPTPRVLHRGGPLSVEDALALLGEYGHHGAVDAVEGCVWRVERKGAVEFLAKYVRPTKQDGVYLPELSGQAPIWHWRPGEGVMHPQRVAREDGGAI